MPHRYRGDLRRLLGRLGDHRIAGDQRRRDLAGEDREREIPRADADEDAAPAMAQHVASRRSGRASLRHERNARLRRVVAAEVDRLAHLRDCVVERLAAFGLQDGDQRVAVCLVEPPNTLERGGAVRNRRLVPRREAFPAPVSASPALSPFACGSGVAAFTLASSASKLAQ